VYVGKKLLSRSDAAATAKAAAAAAADVVVKVYAASVPGCHTQQLKGYADNERTVLIMLQEEQNVVQLLATADLDQAAAAGRSAAVASTHSSQYRSHGGCSSSNSKYGSSNCNNSNNSNNQDKYLQSCLVLEYLPGGAISNNGKCPEGLAKVILRPVLGLLKVMHSGELGARIVHRDIKPDNLLQRDCMPEEGKLPFELVLADFGACFIQTRPGDSPIVGGMHTCIGTPMYQASEMASAAGQAAAAAAGGFDASIDCYAFGVTVTQMMGCIEVQEGMSVEVFQQQLVAFVNGTEDATASAAVREFVGCCCGVGEKRSAEAAKGVPARMTAAQLLETDWMRG
jgi:serine/threonine protein kinase